MDRGWRSQRSDKISDSGCPEQPCACYSNAKLSNRYVTCKKYIISPILYSLLRFPLLRKSNSDYRYCGVALAGVYIDDVGHKPYAWLLGATM